MSSENKHPRSDKPDGWTLNGWHVLASLLVFFGVMLAANGVFIYYAVSTFTGIETADAYRSGIAYNNRLEEARELDKLGWTGEIKPKDGRIELILKNASGAPVRGVRIDGKVGRPSTDSFDRAISFEDAGSGHYRSEQVELAPGNWIVAIEAHDPVRAGAPPRYRLKERLWLSH